MITTLAPSGTATSGPGRAYRPAPLSASAVPPGRTVPAFAAIRRGGGGRHRLRRAGRHRPGLLVTALLVAGLLAAAAVLAAGPLRSGPPAPVSAPAPAPSIEPSITYRTIHP